MLNKQKKYLPRRRAGLGQHFLKNKKILEEMARSAQISKKDTILEVGPGTGTLTELLVRSAKKVIAVEKDRDLIPLLQEKFRNFKNIEIIEGDVLKGDIRLPKNYKIVANIPYYITSRFLRIFLSGKNKPQLIVLMIQKEVAERILARDGRESLLSLSVKAYAKAEIIRRVSKNFFSPPPKVDSAIIKLTPYPPLKVRGVRGVMDAEKILAIVKIAFQKKRKMLRASIGKKIPLPEKYQTKRPEELSLEDWAEIVVK